MRVPEVLLVGLGGATGTLARYTLDETIEPGAWPWSTLTVNLLGSLALGLLVGAGAGLASRRLLGTGVLGGFTTYSAFAVQVDDGLRGGDDLATVLGYAAATLVGGAVLAAAGLRTGERLR